MLQLPKSAWISPKSVWISLPILLILIVVFVHGCFSSVSKNDLSKEELLLQKMIRQREEISAIQNLQDESTWQSQFEKQKQAFNRKTEEYDHLMRTFEALIEHPLYQNQAKDNALRQNFYQVEVYPAKILSKMKRYQESTDAYLSLAQSIRLDPKSTNDSKMQSWINELQFFAGFQMYEIEEYAKALVHFQKICRHQGKSTFLNDLRRIGTSTDPWVKHAEWYYAWTLYLMADLSQSALFLEALLPLDLSTVKTEHKSVLYWASEAYEKLGGTQQDAYQATKFKNKAQILRLSLMKIPKLDYYTLLILRKYQLFDQARHLIDRQRKQFFIKKFETEISNLSLGPISAHQVFSFILKESNFNPKAKSPAQAFGLMQLLEKTAKALIMYAQENDQIHQASLIDPNQIDLYDPQMNLILGTYYLHLLHTQYLGQMPLVAIAYNAGPVALKTWIDRQKKMGDQVELDLFIEKIPFKEAREYVKKIIEFESYYEMLYAQSPLENLANSIPMMLNLKVKETILF
jgi:soluble lytic murein transglycosylase